MTIAVPEAQLEDLRDRLRRARLPQGDEGWALGTDPAYLRELVRYWAEEYDQRAAERRMNAFEHLLVPVEGRRVHLVRPAWSGRPVVLLLHGWPGSFVQMLDLMDLLAPDFDVVAASLPGFGYSDAIPGAGERRMARVLDLAMRELGVPRYAVHGTDFGAGVASWMAADVPDRLLGVHIGGTSPRAEGIGRDDQPELQQYARDVAAWRATEVGYGAIQSTKPQTLAAALSDSPAGLASWIVEKLRRWSDCGGDLERRFTRDQVLLDVALYWFTDSIGSSIRLYADSDEDPDLRDARVPIAHLMSDRDMLPTPRAWVERTARIDRWTQVDRGGHFIEWEEPQLVADDIRAFLAG